MWDVEITADLATHSTTLQMYFSYEMIVCPKKGLFNNHLRKYECLCNPSSYWKSCQELFRETVFGFWKTFLMNAFSEKE